VDALTFLKRKVTTPTAESGV